VQPSSTPAALVAQLGLPLVLKPRDQSGSRGYVIASSREEVAAALQPGLLAERFIHGIEMSIETFRQGGRTLFANPTSYHLPLWANIVPAPLGEEMRRLVLGFNDQVLSALEVRRGLAHLEIYLTPAGPVVGELAVRPPGGYLMRLLELVYGFDPWEALLRILVLGETVAFPDAGTGYAGVRILHPGAGTVVAVEGLAALRARPGVVEAEVRVGVGSRLGPRLGTGQEAGHLIAAAPTLAEVAALLDAAPELLRIRVRPPPAPGAA
jgi:biotin carboxylase